MSSTPKDPLNGFHIPPILLKSSESTAIRYKLSTTLSKDIVDSINGIGGARMTHDRLIAIYEAGATLSFQRMRSEIFYTNIRAVDSDLIKLLPEIVLNSYLFGKSRLLDVLDVSNKKLHHIKFKRLLRTLALGMRPDTPWSGDVVSYPVHSQNLFDEYLLENAYLCAPGAGMGKYGVVYEADGEAFFDLNFQIRFEPTSKTQSSPSPNTPVSSPHPSSPPARSPYSYHNENQFHTSS